MSDNQKPPSSTVGFQVLFLYAYLLATLSSEVFKEIGELIGMGIIALIAFILKLLDEILAAFEIPYQVRSGMWLAVTLGPYLGIVTLDRWQFALLSAIIGLFGAVVGFIVGYYNQSLIRFVKNCVHAIAVHERLARFIIRFLGILIVGVGILPLVIALLVAGHNGLAGNWKISDFLFPLFFGMFGLFFTFVGIRLWRFSESGRTLAGFILLVSLPSVFLSFENANTILGQIIAVLFGVFCGFGLIYLMHPTVKSLFNK